MKRKDTWKSEVSKIFILTYDMRIFLFEKCIKAIVHINSLIKITSTSMYNSLYSLNIKKYLLNQTSIQINIEVICTNEMTQSSDVITEKFLYFCA